MMMSNVLRTVATLGPVGYVKGSGTLATLCMLPVMYMLSSANLYLLSGIFIFLCAIGLVATRSSLAYFSDNDPHEIVIDECIGSFITFYGLASGQMIFFVGFLLFRFFDITKWFGIKYAENIGGAIGVIMDDMVAGLFAHCILRILISAGIIT